MKHNETQTTIKTDVIASKTADALLAPLTTSDNPTFDLAKRVIGFLLSYFIFDGKETDPILINSTINGAIFDLKTAANYLNLEDFFLTTEHLQIILKKAIVPRIVKTIEDDPAIVNAEPDIVDLIAFALLHPASSAKENVTFEDVKLNIGFISKYLAEQHFNAGDEIFIHSIKTDTTFNLYTATYLHSPDHFSSPIELIEVVHKAIVPYLEKEIKNWSTTSPELPSDPLE